jgi:hypothetical protein
LFPYLVGAGGLVAIGVFARRWSRPSMFAPVTADGAMDAELNARLDDELRDLD